MTDIPSLPEAHRRVAVAYLEALSLMSAAYQDRSGAVGFVGRLSGSEARILLIASVEPVASALRVSENPRGRWRVSQSRGDPHGCRRGLGRRTRDFALELVRCGCASVRRWRIIGIKS